MCTHSSYLDVFIIALLSLCSYGYVDYTENTELIQQRVGYDLKLHCDLKGLVDDEKLKDIKIHWFFKQCGESYFNLKSCHESYEDDWTELPCEKSFCNVDLLLHNITEKYSGLYKCTVYPNGSASKSEHALDIRFVRTYQLDVRNTTSAVPEFLDNNPLNRTAIIGTQIVFQCRVRSEAHATIKWFHRIPETRNGNGFENFVHDNFSSRIVRYNGHTYELLPTAHEKYIRDETYLSKLIMNGVRWQDEGQYACVAVNYRGHRIRLFYLSVMPSSIDDREYFEEYDEEHIRTDPREFWILFLMPLSLAMLPASVWLVYKIYKSRKSSKSLPKRNPRYPNEQARPELRRILQVA